jgi:hypothetical protein
MEPGTRTADACEFCLVLTPTLGAASRATQALRERFGFLPEKTRGDLAAVVAELVDSAVERRPGTPITVAVVLGADSIRGEVADHQGDLASFEIPLAR